MTILKHNFSLHKLYGFLLLNTSLIVFMPAAAILVEITNRSNVPLQLIATMVLALSGIILSILFILKKNIAIKLLSALLIITILFVVFLMIQTLFALGEIGFTPALLVVNTFGFFIVEGVLGLLIIHSEKLLSEFDNYQ